MVNLNDIRHEIAHWKAARHAVILAHHYQDEEVQEVADSIGDTLKLAQHAESFRGAAIVVCGSKFMAELCKVLNPDCQVLLPDLNAGCSLVDSCPAEAIRLFRKSNPDHFVVSYMNTSVAVKSESDSLCTSQNAVAVVNSVPASQPILFVPDINLGNWVKRQTGRKNMHIWQGACILHSTFSARRLIAMRAEHPDALVAAHTGSPSDVLRAADFVGSISSIIDWCGKQSATEFVVCADSGISHSLHRNSNGKKFYFLASENCNCSECPYMRINTLEKLLTCLKNLGPSIQLAKVTIAKARIAYDRMLRIQ
jgi:quinolinate synthase